MKREDPNWEEESSIRNFGVQAQDPGYVYIIKDTDRYKIGCSKSRKSRIQEAKTWLPHIEVIGVKPFWNHRQKEKMLQIGYSHCWYDGEWFKLHDDGYFETLIPLFRAFSDTDINSNSIDFIYWFNGSGMAELRMELSSRQQSIKSFQKELAIERKK